jgi:hypothetical protein
MAATGYLLQVADEPATRDWLANAHDVASVLWVLGCAVHWWAGRRGTGAFDAAARPGAA